jgi:lipopolysaccharide/colanic/teichoic acid biosynthesis glycosyltransferase/ubiquinone/menaquinone biosynthesis C-methylase UbiE
MTGMRRDGDGGCPVLIAALPGGNALSLWRTALSGVLDVAGPMLPPGSHIIEIGYGSGRLACSLARHLGWRIAGFDISAGAGESARLNAERFGVSDLVEFHVQDPFVRPPDIGRYDGAFIKTVLYNARDSSEYAYWLDWIADSLKPGGIFVILESGRAGALMRLYRWFRKRGYRNAMLYSSSAEVLYGKRFEFLYSAYYGGWSQLVSLSTPLYRLCAAAEKFFVETQRRQRLCRGPGPQEEGTKPGLVKRLFDIAAAAIGLLVLSPLLLAIAILIKRGDAGPLFYRGLRIGLRGRPFRILKLRTMVVNADTIGGPSTADGDPRVTGIGRFLRKYKLDELPQLINVLLGQMSLVGPRPEVPEYVALFTEEEKAILIVRPGITDWASIWNPDEGALLAGAADPERVYLEKIRPKKIRLQLKYVREHSLWVDLKILLLTLTTLLFGRKA